MARYQQQLDQYEWHGIPGYPAGLVKDYPDGFTIEIHEGSHYSKGRYEWQVWHRNLRNRTTVPQSHLFTVGYSPDLTTAKQDAERAVAAEQRNFAVHPEASELGVPLRSQYRRPDCGCQHVAAHRRSK